MIEGDLIKYQNTQIPEFILENNYATRFTKGTIKDMNLNITAVLDKDLGLAKTISEKWEICDKVVEVNWRLLDIEYKSETYAYVMN